MRKISIALFLSVVLSSCRIDNKKVGLDIFETIDVSLKEDDFCLSSVFTSCDIVSLESNNDLLITNPNEILFNDKYFVTYSKTDVVVFTRKGDFYSRINSIGKGPGEYEYIIDLYVDFKKEEITFIDFYNQKILEYTLDGRFIQEIYLGFYVDAFSKIDDAKWVLYCTQACDKTNYYLNIFDKKKEKIVSKWFPMRLNDLKYLNFWNNTSFFTSENNINFVINPYDTVYEIQGDDVDVRYVFNYGDHNIPHSFYKNSKIQDVIEFSQLAMRNKYAYNWDEFYDTKDLLFFTFKYEGKYHRAIYNKTKKTTTVIYKLANDLLINGYSFYQEKWIWPKGVYKNEIAFAMDALNFKDILNVQKESMASNEWDDLMYKNENLKKIYQGITLINNPVIIIYHTK